jgi:transcriptional regulator with GAF, ATPase, and Fis domain
MPRRAEIPERDKVRAALQEAHGIQDRAAKALGVPRSTLQKWLTGPFQDLKADLDGLREAYAPDGRGRPWTMDGARTRAAVERAWIKSGYRLTTAARLLGLPRTSVRHLLHRYALPNLPAPGRKPTNGNGSP